MTVSQPTRRPGVVLPNKHEEPLAVEKLDTAMDVLSDLLGELELEFSNSGPKAQAAKKKDHTPGKLDTALSVLHQQLAELEQDLRKRSAEVEKTMDRKNSNVQSKDLSSTQSAVPQENSHLKAGDQKEILAKVLPMPLATAPSVAAYQRSTSPNGYTWRLPPGTHQQFVHSPRNSMTQGSSPGRQQMRSQILQIVQQPQVQQQQVTQTSTLSRSPTPVKDIWPPTFTSAQVMANTAITSTANLAPGTPPATAPVLGHRALSPGPGGAGRPANGPPPAPFAVQPTTSWRSPSEGRVFGSFGRNELAQSPMRRRDEQPAASRPGFSPSPRNGRGSTPGFGTTASPCTLSRAGRSPSEGRVTYGGPWTSRSGDLRCFRREGTSATSPGPHSFNLCRSSTSTSSNPSFYAQSVMGGGGFNTAPVPAASYIVDLADPIDQMLGSALRTLDSGAASKLMLRRLAQGKYEIDSRKVTVRPGWSEEGSGLMVVEDQVRDPRGSATPLWAYLNQAGNVVASLTGHRADMPKIARVPKSQRLTFDDKQAEKNLAAQIEKLGSERCESMRLAVEQARLREEAAEAYEKLTQGFAPSRILQPQLGPDHVSL